MKPRTISGIVARVPVLRSEIKRPWLDAYGNASIAASAATVAEGPC
jgi:hypothetical protein